MLQTLGVRETNRRTALNNITALLPRINFHEHPVLTSEIGGFTLRTIYNYPLEVNEEEFRLLRVYVENCEREDVDGFLGGSFGGDFLDLVCCQGLRSRSHEVRFCALRIVRGCGEKWGWGEGGRGRWGEIMGEIAGVVEGMCYESCGRIAGEATEIYERYFEEEDEREGEEGEGVDEVERDKQRQREEVERMVRETYHSISRF